MLTLLLTPLFCPAAHAGSWQFSCTGSGSSTFTDAESNSDGYTSTADWTPPSPSTGTSYQLPALGTPSSGFTSSYPGATWTRTVNIQPTITLTWVHGTGETDANDPAPPSVMLIESSRAEWTSQVHHANGAITTASGSADDGIGDAPVKTYDGAGLQSGAVSDSINALKNQIPPSHWQNHSVSGGIVTLKPVFKAQASGTADSTPVSGAFNLGCSFDGYTVTIHPQPYNYHETNLTNNQDGTLTFYYDWLSTSGSKSALTTCFIHEYVTYPGPVGTALFPLSYTMPAPFNGSLNNPTTKPGVGPNGQPATDTNGGMDHQLVPPISSISPHINGGFTGTQLYEFDDTATGETNVQIPGPDSGPWSIVRSVATPDGILWYYNLTKAGATAAKPI